MCGSHVAWPYVALAVWLWPCGCVCVVVAVIFVVVAVVCVAVCRCRRYRRVRCRCQCMLWKRNGSSSGTSCCRPPTRVCGRRRAGRTQLYAARSPQLSQSYRRPYVPPCLSGVGAHVLEVGCRAGDIPHQLSRLRESRRPSVGTLLTHGTLLRPLSCPCLSLAELRSVCCSVLTDVPVAVGRLHG